MKGRSRRTLHQTPSEFAEAAKHKAVVARWQAKRKPWEIEEEEKRRERICNMKMPAHRPKNARGKRISSLSGGMFREGAVYERVLSADALAELRERTLPRFRKRGII